MRQASNKPTVTHLTVREYSSYATSETRCGLLFWSFNKSRQTRKFEQVTCKNCLKIMRG